MKHKLNSFSGAFEGTTKGLEGIANALKREEPTPPPYVPTGFPCYFKIDYDFIDKYDSQRKGSSIFKIPTSGEGFMATRISGPDHDYQLRWVDNSDIWKFDINDVDLFKIHESTLTFFDINSDAVISLEWVDPSTLPQS